MGVSELIYIAVLIVEGIAVIGACALAIGAISDL